LEGRDETTRVEVEEGTRFVVRVYFNVLERDVFFEEDEKDALDERAELG